MSKNRVNNVMFLPVPVKGMDLRIPVSSMPPEYSPFMVNFLVQGGKLRKRNRHSFYGRGNTTESSVPIVIPSQTNVDIINIGENDTFSLSAGPTSTPAEVHPPFHDYIYFNGNLLVCGYGVVYILNESSLAYTSGLTFTGLISTDRQPITHYRGRVYVGASYNLYYGGVAATSGAMTAFSVQSFLNSARIFGLGTFNYVAGSTTEQMLVIVGAYGEVLVYAGSYPGGTDWYLVNKFDLGTGQLDTDCPFELIETGEDLLINPKFTPHLYSVRAMLSGRLGAAARLEPLKALEPLWTEALVNTASQPGYVGTKSCAYWPQKNALVIHVNLWNILKHPYLDRYRNVLDGFEDTNSAFSFLIHIDLNTQVATLHTYPAIAGSTSDMVYGQLRAGLRGVVAPCLVTASAALKAASVQLFADEFASGTSNKDWDGATASSSAFDAYCTFAPIPQSSDIESIQNAILFSNIHSSHSLSYGVNQNFDHGPATFTAFSSQSSTVIPRSDVLPMVGSGRGLMVQLKEGGSYETVFESYGLRVIGEFGGLY